MVSPSFDYCSSKLWDSGDEATLLTTSSDLMMDPFDLADVDALHRLLLIFIFFSFALLISCRLTGRVSHQVKKLSQTPIFRR